MARQFDPVRLADFDEIAQERLPRPVYDYFRGGANDERTLRDNSAAFSRIGLRPRVMRDVSAVDTRCTFLGREFAMPVMCGVVSQQRMAHPDGECATARAAEKAGVPVGFSTYSTSSVPEMNAAAPGAFKVHQIYVFRTRAMTAALIRRAEETGCGMIALTVDNARPGRREHDLPPRNAFQLPDHLSYRLVSDALPTAKAIPRSNAARHSTHSGADTFGQSMLTWDDIRWVKSLTRLPVFPKGIATAEDAELAIRAGADGVWVSNHGGRQLDGSPAGVDALPAVAAAVRGRVPIVVDGGIRRGTDVLKCVALGADMVAVGRPVPYSLAWRGAEGVERMLSLLRDELVTAMGLCGATSLRGIERAMVTTEHDRLVAAVREALRGAKL